MEIDAIHTVVASIYPETCPSILYSPSSLRCLLSLPRSPPRAAAECPRHLLERAYLASTTSLEAGILWSAPAERSGDGAFSRGNALQQPKRRRRFALPAHSKWWY